ncbi:TetR/AcrR family transcriptional regulator [bacterium]|nr:TetR/AcrR family transcriptional regulator [bacterium]
MLRISLEERKAYIAQAAMEVFARRGYKTTSLQEIAEKVEITKAGIYHYFKTKEEILYFILVNNNLEKIDRFKAVDPTQNGKLKEPLEILRHIIRSYAHISLETNDVALLSMRERHQLTGKNLESFQQMEKEIFSLLKAKIKVVPQIKAHYDTNTIAYLIISMSAWFGYWLKNDGRLSREEIVEQSIEIICSGVLET